MSYFNESFGNDSDQKIGFQDIQPNLNGLKEAKSIPIDVLRTLNSTQI